MRIQLRATNIAVTEQARLNGERRARFALGRFAARIRAVSIVLKDENGPRGGLDTTCRIRVTGNAGWTLTVSDVDHDVQRALARALGRAERAVARLVERQLNGEARDTLRHRAS